MVPELAAEDFTVREAVYFVENNHSLFPVGAEFGNGFIHGGHLFVVLRVAEVHNVNEQIGKLDLLKRRLEGFDDCVRQLADETDSICEQNLLSIGQHKLASRRIERAEEPILGGHSRASKAVEKRGFSSIGIAHERRNGPIPAKAALALDRAVFRTPSRSRSRRAMRS